MQQTEKILRVKNHQGRVVQVVREHYLREDVPCCSPLCLASCGQYQKAEQILLPSPCSHYVIPDCQLAQQYLEILEYPEIQGAIFMHTVMHAVQHEGGRRHHRRVQNLLKDQAKNSVVFHNEFQKYSYCPRKPQETLHTWQTRSVYEGACWYYNHLAGQVPIVMLTTDKQVVEEYSSKTEGVLVLHLEQYLSKFWPDLESAHHLYQSLAASLTDAPQQGGTYEGYLPSEVLEAGIKKGSYVQGCLQVNRHNAGTEAFIRRAGVSGKSNENDGDILISGMSHRNRAVHGDSVVVALLPRLEWRARSNYITQNQEQQDDNAKDDKEDTSSSGKNTMPTGRVVGVLQRNWRDYVASFAQTEDSSQQKRGGKVLVVPWDWRIPKIRISTRQAELLKAHRIVVRIDSWEVGSQYPNGHFVRSLGVAGDVETEVAALLIENSISAPPFTEAQLKELPTNTEANPWMMEDNEVKKRRDLRESHLIFSIDPKGCEDVDDTLSVRELPNGHLELGVHIADVTFFVPPGSLTDLEARSRSTSVYLADRRYDMLPAILSADLCSLISGVDRYAMSVMWELDDQYEVKDVWYGRTVIRSQYKLYYELAQEMHDGADDDHLVDNIPELERVTDSELPQRLTSLRWSVSKLMEVARALKSRRTCGGALTLEGTEVQVQMSESSESSARSIEGLVPKQALEIHETIAECMIFANHWVAKKIAQTFPTQALLRHHPLPREEHFESLINCAASKGFTINTSSNKALAESLDECEDPQDPNVNKLLRTLATQAMSNAAYFSTGSLSREQFFHYGLALDYYTHFTSPIRRYADVVVHRLLMAALTSDLTVVETDKALSQLSEHINHRHRAAQNAQRDSTDLFQALFFKDKQTDDDELCVVDAIVFQLRSNGMLVFVPRYGIKGALYLRSKERQVLYVSDVSGVVEWTGGSLTQSQQSITVNSLYGPQKYKLFDHITVRLSVQHSHSHASCLKFELVSNKPYETMETGSAKQQKAQIIQEVHNIAEERQKTRETVDLGDDFLEWKKLYGQSKKSFYHVLQNIKRMAVMDV